MSNKKGKYSKQCDLSVTSVTSFVYRHLIGYPYEALRETNFKRQRYCRGL